MALSAFGFSTEYIANQLLGIPGFVLFLCFRGFCQAWTARKLGDSTAYLTGYMTMNPMKHINFIGFIFLILFGFGFSNPVPVNTRNFKNIKRDNALQILSAPLSGLLLMIISSFMLYLFYFIGVKTGMISIYLPASFFYTGSIKLLQVIASSPTAGSVVYAAFLCILGQTALISIFLSVFFLLPLPGFDGYKLIANFLPYKYYSALYKIEKYSLFIFIGFILLIEVVPQAYGIVEVPAVSLLKLFNRLFAKLFSLFL